jgi:hypothetical protein
LVRTSASYVAQRSFGVSLALNQPTPVSSRFETYALNALIRGRQLAEQSNDFRHWRSVLQHGIETTQYAGIFNPNHPGEALLIQSLYWFIASVHVRRYAPERHSMLTGMFGAQSQSLLTRALIALNRNDRERSLGIVKLQFPELHRSWRSDYIGAMAVARLAYGLLRKDITPVIPTMDLDVNNKIDLLCDNPHDSAYTICFQVRAAQNTTTTFTQLLPEMMSDMDFPWHTSRERALFHSTWTGVCRFSIQYNVNVVPIVAQIQLKPWPFHELENCVALFKGLRDFLDQHD